MFRLLRLAANFLCTSALLILPTALGTQTALKAGESYTFYCNSVSSQARIVTCSPLICSVYKYLLGDSLTGESTVYKTQEGLVKEVMQEFSAELLFQEEACGVVNYYCYSPFLGEGVALNGYTVNLHLAQSQTQTAVGTPLVFGGF